MSDIVRTLRESMEAAPPGKQNVAESGPAHCETSSEYGHDNPGNYQSIRDVVNHPAHYGGKNNIYETIKVIEAWELGFNLGNAVKYISRAGKKGDRIDDLKKARWYLDREINNAGPK